MIQEKLIPTIIFSSWMNEKTVSFRKLTNENYEIDIRYTNPENGEIGISLKRMHIENLIAFLQACLKEEKT